MTTDPWRNDPPDRDGWYWHRDWCGNERPRCVQASSDDWVPAVTLVEGKWRPLSDLGGQWGPEVLEPDAARIIAGDLRRAADLGDVSGSAGGEEGHAWMADVLRMVADALVGDRDFQSIADELASAFSLDR